MAGNAKTNGFLSGIAGAAMAFAAAVGPAQAQEATPAAFPLDLNAAEITKNPETGEYETDRSTELLLLRQASKNAGKFAKECFARGEDCVGGVFHIGDDFYDMFYELAEEHDVPFETVQAVILQQVEEDYGALFAKHGVDFALFARPNPGTAATGMAYHTNDIIYELSNGRGDFNLDLAEKVIPDVVRSLQTLRELEMTQLSPSLDNGS